MLPLGTLPVNGPRLARAAGALQRFLGWRRTGDADGRRCEGCPAQPAVDARVQDLTDEELLHAYATGDRAALRQLMTRYQADLLAFLTGFLGSDAAADDVFQETFLQVHLSAEQFDPQRRLKPWLFTIAANKARDYHRRMKRRRTLSLSAPVGDEGGDRFVDLLASDSPVPGAGVESREEAQQVRMIIDALPAHLREILLLAYFQKMPYGQIAECLGIPLGTVKSRLHAAVAAFARRWRTAYAPEADAPGTEGHP